MASFLTRISMIALALVGFAGSAQALQFAEYSFNDCDAYGCEGSTIYMSAQEEVGGSWVVTYSIDTTNYTGSKIGMNQIGFKIIDNWTTGMVLTSPVGSMTDWNPVYDDPISGNGPTPLCQTTAGGDTDKVCIQGFVNIKDTPGVYTWTIRLDDGTLITDPTGTHFGGQYANGQYRSPGHIISGEGSAPPVPEPTAAVLFGLGALLVTRKLRRR